MTPEDFNPNDYISEDAPDGIHYFEPSTYPEFRQEVGFTPWENLEEDEGEDEDQFGEENEPEKSTDSGSPEEGRVENPDTAQNMAEAEDAGRDAAKIAEQAENAEVAGEATATAAEAAEAAEAIEAAAVVVAAPEEGVALGVIAGVIAVIAVIAVVVGVFYIALMAVKLEEATADTTNGGTGGATGTYTPPANLPKYCTANTSNHSLSEAQKLSTYGSSASGVEKNLVSLKFQGKTIRVHRLVAPCFQAAIDEIAQSSTKSYKITQLGSWCWRNIRNASCHGGDCGSGVPGRSSCKLSNHSFGTAIDINWDKNDYSCSASHDIPQEWTKILYKYGISPGGDKSLGGYCDWMHYEYKGDPR